MNMRKKLTIFELGRPLTSFLIALAIVTAAFVGTGYAVFQQITAVLIASLIGFIFGMGGNSLNDYLDFKVDKINHPERPIPSGKIRRSTALYFSITMFSFALILTFILTTFSGYGVMLFVLFSIFLQILYEKKLKQIKFLGNILIGILASFSFLFGGIVMNDVFATRILALCSFLSITAREIVKDIEDIEGDYDKQTLPKLIGINNAGMISAVLIIIAICTSILIFFPLSYFGTYYALFIVPADIILIISIPIIFKNPYWARRIMKFSMIMVLLAFIIGSLFK